MLKIDPAEGSHPWTPGLGLLDGVRFDGTLFDPDEDPEFCGSESSSFRFSRCDQPGLGGAFFKSGVLFDDWPYGSKSSTERG